MDELEQLKKLAGVNEFTGYTLYSLDPVPKRQIEREKNIKPGDPEWFDLWMAKSNLNMPAMFRGRKKK